MILLYAENITRSFTERPLLVNICLSIHDGDKIGLIGVNGTGKTTLLKIIAGREEAESGTITKANGLRIGYLPQDPVFQQDAGVLEQVLNNVSANQRDAMEYECKSILTRLGISDFEQPVSQLSGGMKKRVALASVIVSPAELLILDEPTNHLDNDMAEWLEQYLARFNGAILIVTHDRYFLDRVTNQIAELADGTIYRYDGNYSTYLSGVIAREDMLETYQRKIATLYRKELEWMRRGIRARGTRSKSRVERFEVLNKANQQLNSEKLTVQAHSARLGKKIIVLRDISKSYVDELLDGSTRTKTLISDFEYTVLRNDRIGIVGPNGAGKSTLLKIIMGVVAPDSGTVEIGETVKIGYFSQENEALDLSLRVIDFIQNIAYQFATPSGTLTASQMLERFLFPSSTHSTVIGRLSGGERRRLFLLSILMTAPNVLLLDEPTNDLDIQTLTVLEDYLDDFPGAVIVISHDRYFLDRAVQRIFLLEGNGAIIQYPGGYSDYLEDRLAEARERQKAEKEAQAAQAAKAARAAKSAQDAQAAKSAQTAQAAKSTQAAQAALKTEDVEAAPQKNKRGKLTFKEQWEFDTIEHDIATLEQEIATLEQRIASEATNYELLQTLTQEKSAAEEALSHKLERWVYLTEIKEA